MRLLLILMLVIYLFQFIWLVAYKHFMDYKQSWWLSGIVAVVFFFGYFLPYPSVLLLPLPISIAMFIFSVTYLKNWLLAAILVTYGNILVVVTWLMTTDLWKILYEVNIIDDAIYDRYVLVFYILRYLILFLFVWLVARLIRKHAQTSAILLPKKNYPLQALFYLGLLLGLNFLRQFSIWKNYPESFYYIIFILVLLFIFVNLGFLLVAKLNNQTSKVSTLTKQLDKNEEHISLANEFRHDYRNILLSLTTYLENGQTEEALELIAEITNYSKGLIDNDLLPIVRRIDNPSLQGILLNFLVKCEENNVTVHLSVHPVIHLSDIKMNLIDFVRCLSILVDNAFEAASMTEKPEIFLQVEKKEEALYITLENNYSGKITMEQILRKNFTSKEGHSGKGLHNFITILKRYPKASYSFDLSELLFTAKVRIE